MPRQENTEEFWDDIENYHREGILIFSSDSVVTM